MQRGDRVNGRKMAEGADIVAWRGTPTMILAVGLTSWIDGDIGIAGRGINCAHFDPWVGNAPQAHAVFDLRKLRIVPHDEPVGVYISAAAAQHVFHGAGKLKLKIDIEGSGWSVSLATSPKVKWRFTQIVCEFPMLDLPGEAGFSAHARTVFAKLTETHCVFHVHGNVCVNVVVPQTLELGFAARGSDGLADSGEIFSTPRDRPNEAGRANRLHGPFRFEERLNGIANLSARAAE